jgi:hypothetical protein
LGNSFLLIVVGLLLFYLVISDKWRCVEGFAGCVTGKASGANVNLPSNTALPNLPNVPQVNIPTIAANTNWIGFGY